ncbi:Protein STRICTOSIDINE SYNTHASE-LIKE 6, partial [Prunus dulcis]
GLLNVTSEGEVKLLTDEAEGVKFGITDGVDVAVDGTIYFTDASYKYNLKHFVWDFLEGRPYGRFMSYDSATKQTTVLVRDLYFANGLVVSPDQSHVIFCETPMRRCRKYYVQGEKKGSVETFIDQLPGLPDNIRYDGEGHYWIALSMAPTLAWDLAVRYPFIKKSYGNYGEVHRETSVEKNVWRFWPFDLVNGNLISHYYDPGLSLVSSVIKIGNHIFCGSIIHPYMLRLNIQQYPTMAVA